MADDSYHGRALVAFQNEPAIARSAFEVEKWGKGADHRDLLQVKKPAWRLLTTDALLIGYEGIEVHYESCRPGHWVLHCELWPRQGKREKDQVFAFTELLNLKGEITRLIRELGQEAGWERTLGAHLKRARADPSHPSSLIVYTFDLGLPVEHEPEALVEKALKVISMTEHVIDAVLIESAPVR